ATPGSLARADSEIDPQEPRNRTEPSGMAPNEDTRGVTVLAVARIPPKTSSRAYRPCHGWCRRPGCSRSHRRPISAQAQGDLTSIPPYRSSPSGTAMSEPWCDSTHRIDRRNPHGTKSTGIAVGAAPAADHGEGTLYPAGTPSPRGSIRIATARHSRQHDVRGQTGRPGHRAVTPGHPGEGVVGIGQTRFQLVQQRDELIAESTRRLTDQFGIGPRIG